MRSFVSSFGSFVRSSYAAKSADMSSKSAVATLAPACLPFDSPFRCSASCRSRSHAKIKKEFDESRIVEKNNSTVRKGKCKQDESTTGSSCGHRIGGARRPVFITNGAERSS